MVSWIHVFVPGTNFVISTGNVPVLPPFIASLNLHWDAIGVSSVDNTFNANRNYASVTPIRNFNP